MSWYTDTRCPPPDARYWAKVQITPDHWLWTGAASRAPDGNQYGHLTRNRRSYRAHRVSYEAAVGPIPAGMVLDHRCLNTLCVNPAHLEPVSQIVNILRGEGWGGKNSRKDSCPQGHPYTEANLYVIPSTGGRMCRTCKAAARRAERVRRQQRRALGVGPGKPGRPKNQ